MKKLVLALTAVAAFSGSALAADMAPAYTKAPVMPAPVYNWTGFYLFGGAGYGLWEADTFTSNPVTGLCQLCITQRQGGRGWYGTVGGGYDWQFGGNWVAGVFSDAQFGSISGSIQDQGPFSVGRETLQDTWAIGARIGWLVAPNVLSYFNGGWTGSRWSGTTMVNSGVGAPFGPPGVHTNAFDSNSGWFLGGGVENNLNIFGITAPGLFMKTEYRLAEFGNTTISQRSDLTGLPVFNDIHFKPFVQTISTSLVYRFNWGGPVVSKY